VAQILRDKIAYAVESGVPFEKLVGVEPFFAEVIRVNPDIAFLVLTRADGVPVHAWGGERDGDPSAKLQSDDYVVSRADLQVGGVMVGAVHVGVDRAFIDAKLGEIRFDLATVMLISLLVAFEMLLFVTTVNLTGPIRMVLTLLANIAGGDFRYVVRGGLRDELGSIAVVLNGTVDRVNAAYSRLCTSLRTVREGARQLASEQAEHLLSEVRRRYRFPETDQPISLRRPRLIQVRILTFLFTFAEMLSRPFMPLFVGQVTEPLPGIPAPFTLGLPITVFMLVGAVGMAAAGGWIGRLGQRKAYVLGALLSVAGLVGTGTADGLASLLAWRVVSAAGYALMFMACQALLLENSGEEDRVKSTAVFVGALMVGEICAPAIGGILADRIGFRMVFGFGALVSLVSAALAWRIMFDDSRRKQRAPAQRSRKPVFRLLLRNGRFVVLMLFVGMPAKILLTGFLYFLVPLSLTELGATQSQIGRIAMVWGVSSVLLNPLVAPIADRYRCHGLLVGLGGILAGLGLIPVVLWPDASHILLGVVALGVGQALSIAPQLALATRICAKEIRLAGAARVVGRYRLLERIGSAIGPFLAGFLAVTFGSAGAVTALGLFGAVSAVAFSVVFLVWGIEPNRIPQWREAPP
ncbi:MAG: MFS transporter, partial [Actinomycetota bacterium]